MRTLRDYLCEGIFDTNTDIVPHVYHPKNKNELIKCIKEIVDKHKPGDTIDLNCIDTSRITDMNELFEQFPSNCNYDVSQWDVSNVKEMYGMFSGIINFDCDISGWDVSSVEDMSDMFFQCLNFNCDLSKWDVRNVRYYRDTFKMTPLEYKKKLQPKFKR